MISIVITCLDDHAECNATIQSIRATAGDKPEIIVIDDASQVPLSLVDKDCKLVRNEFRCGVGASRHIGALHATGEVLLLIDAHMRFLPGWYDKAVKQSSGKPTTAYCCTCLQLSPSNMNVNKPGGEYNGASINFFGKDKNGPGNQYLEGVWLGPVEGDDYPLACVMGASYLLPRDFFLHIGGLRLLRSWGSDEPYLSLKWWLAGGEIRMFKGVQIGHQFRQASSYKTDTSHLWYNKILIARTCLPDAHAERLLKKFPFQLPEANKARQLIVADSNIVMAEKHYLESIRSRDFDWFLKFFGISFP